MNGSFSIGKIAGSDVRINFTFLLLLAYCGWSGYEAGGATMAKVSVLFAMLLFLCVLLHEFGHAMAARYYGIRTPSITLSFIGGLARLERIPENAMQELVIAIAGPMVNVVIVAVLWIALGVSHLPMGVSFHPDSMRALALVMMKTNVWLIAFNMIPAFPMDGGRVLRALLAMRWNRDIATVISARTGQVVAVCFALIGLFGVPQEMQSIPVLGWFATMFGTGSNFFLIFIAFFVFSGAQQELAFAGMRAAASRLRVADAMVVQFRSFRVDVPIAQAISAAEQEQQPVYPVMDSNSRAMGMVLRNDLLRAGVNSGATIDSISKHVPTVSADAQFGEAFALMQQSGSPVLPVVNAGGQIVGLVSLNLLTERARAKT